MPISDLYRKTLGLLRTNPIVTANDLTYLLKKLASPQAFLAHSLSHLSISSLPLIKTNPT
jgi:hypothetical protein